MAYERLQTILEEIQSLDMSELQQVRYAVDTRLEAQGDTGRMRRLIGALREDGLLMRIATTRMGNGPVRRLIRVQGEPVSQTIIEERR